MKRLLLSGIMLLSLGCVNASAQSSITYDDDIYYSSEQARADAQREAQQHKDDKQRQSNPDSYTNTGDSYHSSDGNYNNEDDNIDYEDDYYYASHINRFNYPFYNMGYYSGYYNPYWYNRNWVDPSWGYNPWQSGISLSFGYGPYWSSGWGYNAWYGYSPFYSYYSYPYYGGYGGSYGCGSPYYSGYWNGYYAGVYGSGSGYGYRNVSYGPRSSLNSVHNTIIRNNSLGHRSPLVGSGAGAYSNNVLSADPRNGFRGAGNNNNGVITPVNPRNSSFIDRTPVQAGTTPSGAIRSNGSFTDGANVRGTVRNESPAGIENPRNYSSSGNNAAIPSSDRRGGGFFGGRDHNNAQSATPRVETQRQQSQRTEATPTPRFENRSYQQPRVEQRTFSQPRTESAPSRSFGGGNSGGGGGGGRSFGGRR